MNLTPLSKDVFKVIGWPEAEIVFTRGAQNSVVGFKFSMINTKNIQFIKR